jgi:hypothetical protein
MLQVSAMGKISQGEFSIGRITQFLETTASTTPGFSGSAYVVLGKLVGMHLGALGGKNGGVSASFLEALLESGTVNVKTFPEVIIPEATTTEMERAARDQAQREQEEYEDAVETQINGIRMRKMKGGRWKVSDGGLDDLRDAVNSRPDEDEERNFTNAVEEELQARFVRTNERMKKLGGEITFEKYASNARSTIQKELRGFYVKNEAVDDTTDLLSRQMELIELLSAKLIRIENDLGINKKKEVDDLLKHYKKESAAIHLDESPDSGNLICPPAMFAGDQNSLSKESASKSPTQGKQQNSTNKLSRSSRQRKNMRLKLSALQALHQPQSLRV